MEFRQTVNIFNIIGSSPTIKKYKKGLCISYLMRNKYLVWLFEI